MQRRIKSKKKGCVCAEFILCPCLGLFQWQWKFSLLFISAKYKSIFLRKYSDSISERRLCMCVLSTKWNEEQIARRAINWKCLPHLHAHIHAYICTKGWGTAVVSSLKCSIQTQKQIRSHTVAAQLTEKALATTSMKIGITKKKYKNNKKTSRWQSK